ncbi:hypothetical protein P609_16230 [Comamonas thiooxydans]|nr:hypothetical protein P609_16230 [Comamonas thiooxydans]
MKAAIAAMITDQLCAQDAEKGTAENNKGSLSCP